MLYLGMEVDKAIEVAEQIDIWVADAIPSAADVVGADDFAADLGAAEDRFCIPGSIMSGSAISQAC